MAPDTLLAVRFSVVLHKPDIPAEEVTVAGTPGMPEMIVAAR